MPVSLEHILQSTRRRVQETRRMQTGNGLATQAAKRQPRRFRAALDDATLRQLHKAATEHGLEVLCEVHDRQELERALSLGCDIIGVNSRNLKSFEVDPELPARLAPHIPARVLRVAESGLSSAA